MKNFLTIIVVVIVSVSVLPLQNLWAQGESLALMGVDVGLHSQYIYRGVVLDDRPVLQTDLWMDIRGVSMTFWGNMSLTDADDEFEGQFNEWDVYINFPLKQMGQFTLGGEIDYLSFPSSSWASGFGTAEIGAWIAGDTWGSPTLQFFWDVWQYHGIYSRFALSQTNAVGPGSLHLDASIGWGDERHNALSGVPEAGGLLYIQTDATYTIKLHELITLNHAISYTALLQSDIRSAYNEQDIAASNLFFSINAALTVSP